MTWFNTKTERLSRDYTTKYITPKALCQLGTFQILLLLFTIQLLFRKET
jgi:hypothetical protein